MLSKNQKSKDRSNSLMWIFRPLKYESGHEGLSDQQFKIYMSIISKRLVLLFGHEISYMKINKS